MRERPFGKADVSVGEVGLGCWQFGGDFGPMEESTAFKIMETATECRMNFFDTADVYGAGRSETFIGSCAHKFSQRPFVATKFGRGADVYPDKYSEDALRQATNASLRRLGVQTLDLMQLHCVPIAVLEDGKIFDWLRKLKKEGKIKSFGASVETVEEGMLCLEQPDITSLQVIFNIFRQKPREQLLPEAKRKGVAIIVRLPLASGLLAGKFKKETKFAATDHRNYNRDGRFFNVGETFAGLPFEKGVELVDKIKPQIPEGMTMAQMALRWILDHDTVSIIIPGASSPQQARDNAGVSRLDPLSSDLHQRLTDFYSREIHPHIRGPY